MPLNILAIEDDPSLQSLLRDILKSEGYSCDIAGTAETARRMLAEVPIYDLAISDLRIPEKTESYPELQIGFQLIEHIAKTSPELYLMVLTSSDRIEHAVRALKLGAYDYLVKPIDIEILKKKLNQINQIISLKEENYKFRQQSDFIEIIGESKEINKMLSIIQKVAPTDAAVLIQGETGTGKELVAKALHNNSLRKGQLVEVNCASIPENLFESELFGHEKGAFTGAVNQQKGKFELADNGTIFLDEIGEMPFNIQAKFLRVLQENQFMRVGGDKPIKVDVRVISATKQDLSLMVKESKFREDLLFRLNTIIVNVPSLRERKSDISVLANYFIGKCSFNEKKSFTPPAMAKLENYKWDGNIRDLKHVIERSCILAGDKKVLDVDDIIIYPHPTSKIISEFEDLFLLPLRKAEEEFEKKYLEHVLIFHGKKKPKAAEFANIEYSNFVKLLKKYGLG